MSSNVEKLENNKVKLTFTVSNEKFQEGINYSYNKNKGNIQLPGFRKGKAPRKMIEMRYGAEFFHEDAINFVFPEAFKQALKENGIVSVSRPEIEDYKGDTTNGPEFTVHFFMKPEATIADYKGLTYKKFVTEVTEEEINQVIDMDRNKNARIVTVTDRPSAMGDILTVDYEGFIDGIPFEGGKGEDYELSLGSRTFIDDFEDQLVYHQAGEEVEVIVTFPGDYHSDDLQGKPAVFKVTIKEIKEKILPEADDDFAQDVSEFDTLEEYKNSIKEKLDAEKQQNSKIHKEESVLEALIEKATVEVPEIMFENQLEVLQNNLKRQIKQTGLEYGMYLSYTGQSEETIANTMMPMAKNQVLGRLSLEAVAKAEALEVTEEDFEEELGRICKAYNMERDVLLKFISDEEKDDIEMDILTQKAMRIVLDSAVEIE